MTKCRKYQDWFIQALSGELTSEQKKEFDSHLEICQQCANKYATMSRTLKVMNQRQRFQPEPEFWESYWDRLADKLEHETQQSSFFEKLWQRFKPMFSIKPAMVYRFAGAAALILIGVFIGKLYFGQRINNSKLAENGFVTERTAVEVKADRYIERSKMLLLGLVNFDPETDDAYALNIPYQRVISRQLVQQSGSLQAELSNSSHQQLASLIADLEIILLQIANLEEDRDVDGIEMIRNSVNRKDILLKINLEKMQAGSQLNSKIENDKEEIDRKKI